MTCWLTLAPEPPLPEGADLPRLLELYFAGFPEGRERQSWLNYFPAKLGSGVQSAADREAHSAPRILGCKLPHPKWRRDDGEHRACVTIHMVASLDGFIARKDGRVDWLETSDQFEDGDTLDPEFVQEFLQTIDCYVMGSRTYETALDFEAKGFGWSYGDKPTFVLTRRKLPRTRDTVEFYSGDLAHLVQERLKPTFRSIWFVGGGAVSVNAFGSDWPTKFAIRSCPS